MVNTKNKNNLKKNKRRRRTLKRKGAGKLRKSPTMQSLKKATVAKPTRSASNSPASFSELGHFSRSSSPASLGRISPASSIGNLSFSEILSLNEMEPIQSPVISDQQKQKKSQKKTKKNFKPIVDGSEDILLSQMNSINLQGPPMIPKIEPIRPTPSVHNLSSIFSYGDDNKSEDGYKSDGAVGQRSRNTSFDSFTDEAINF